MRLALLDQSKSLEAGESGHILVKDNEIEVLTVSEGESIAAVVGSDKFIALVAQEHQVGLQQVDLIVGPKYSISCSHKC
jgi:hypothetical protein